jgi:hypothetical protein
VNASACRLAGAIALAIALLSSAPAKAAADLAGAWVLQQVVPPAGAAPPVGDVAAFARNTGLGANPTRQILGLTPLFRPEVVERIQALAAQRASMLSNGTLPSTVAETIRLLSRCQQPVFAGIKPLPPGATLEILPGQGRLTLLEEFGLVRRVYLRNTIPEDALDESPAGNSIGRWEGRTLVVQTTELDPENSLGIPGTELGHGARVVERMRLVTPDELEIVSTVTAPDLYQAPVTASIRYRRMTDSTFVQQYDCGRTDRSIDPATGEERFDTTPPPKLPPPPR